MTTSSLMSWNRAFWRIMITTKRLTIRPIEENDWSAIKEIWDMLASSHESDKSGFMEVSHKWVVYFAK